MIKMKQFIKRHKIYVLYGVVFCISFAVTWLLPVPDFFKGIASLPAVGSLLSVLYQLWRDERAHERALELQTKEQDFTLGIASHMAEVAYNKHTKFCEEYMARVQKGFQEMLRDGVSRNMLTIGGDLVRIRQKHSAWLTKSIDEKLHPFEKKLIEVGAKEGLLQRGVLTDEKRTKIVEEVYGYFELIMESQKPLNEEEANLAIGRAVERVREILGITTLTELRMKAVDLALERTKDIS
jgi:hypothetical protein